MDLVAGVHKEGSRGGRADFKWSDVTTSTHRENYLGHSLMAPVGRWQKNKDLSWYAKGDKTAEEAAEARREEIRKVKEAEQAAMGEALGFEPAGALLGAKAGNANETPLGEGKGKELERVGSGEVGGTPEERALRRIVEEERAKGWRTSRSRSRDRDRERRRRRHTDHDEGDGRARRRHHHHRHHQDREYSRDRSRDHFRSRLKHERGHEHRSRDKRHRERSYDRRRSPSQERRRSYSRDRDRDYERRR